MDRAHDLVVRGTIVTPVSVVADGWVAVSDGVIAAIGIGAPPPAEHVHDGGRAFVLPGVIDGQTHATSYQGLAGIESTARSAVAGGVTTLVDMPYDNPDPLTSIETLEAKVEAIERLACCDVALYGTVAKGQGAGALEDLARRGICAIKISAFESHPVRFPRIPADEALEVLTAAAAIGLPVGLHNEDQEIVRAGVARHVAAGQTGFEWHSPSRPPAAELAATASFLELGAATGAHVHIVHLSLARGYELVERYRREGVNATAEMCVHYLIFDAGEDGDRLGARMKVNPPIRAGEREALWDQLRQGRSAFVSSDHSSWPIANKLTPSIFDAGAGIPGLETLLPAFYTGLVGRNPSPVEAVARYLSEGPAKFFGLWPRKGGIIVGADADLAVVETKEWDYDSTAAHDGLNWSPYDGQRFKARVAATFVRGTLVWDGEKVRGRPGHGHYIPRQAPESPAGKGRS